MQGLDLLLVGMAQELDHRLALDHAAELEGGSYELGINGNDLQAALRHGEDQPIGFEPRDHLADGGERQSRQLHELTLGNELTGPEPLGEKLLAETLIGALAQPRGSLHRLQRLSRATLHVGDASTNMSASARSLGGAGR